MILNDPAQDFRRRQWHPTPVLLPGKSHGWRSLVGCSPWGRKESDTTERLPFHFSLSCIGEGNGNPLQCSCQLLFPCYYYSVLISWHSAGYNPLVLWLLTKLIYLENLGVVFMSCYLTLQITAVTSNLQSSLPLYFLFPLSLCLHYFMLSLLLLWAVDYPSHF